MCWVEFAMTGYGYVALIVCYIPLSRDIGAAYVEAWAGSRDCVNGQCQGFLSRLETLITSARGRGMSGWPGGRGR